MSKHGRKFVFDCSGCGQVVTVRAESMEAAVNKHDTECESNSVVWLPAVAAVVHEKAAPAASLPTSDTLSDMLKGMVSNLSNNIAQEIETRKEACLYYEQVQSNMRLLDQAYTLALEAEALGIKANETALNEAAERVGQQASCEKYHRGASLIEGQRLQERLASAAKEAVQLNSLSVKTFEERAKEHCGQYTRYWDDLLSGRVHVPSKASAYKGHIPLMKDTLWTLGANLKASELPGTIENTLDHLREVLSEKMEKYTILVGTLEFTQDVPVTTVDANGYLINGAPMQMSMSGGLDYEVVYDSTVEAITRIFRKMGGSRDYIAQDKAIKSCGYWGSDDAPILDWDRVCIPGKSNNPEYKKAEQTTMSAAFEAALNAKDSATAPAAQSKKRGKAAKAEKVAEL
jgi:hypothetical protein